MSVGTDAEGTAPRSVVVRTLKVVGVGLVIVLALVVILTALRTELPRSPGVMSDALGPEPGEPVAAYLERARQSLSGMADDPGDGSGGDQSGGDVSTAEGPRWALVTAEAPWSIAQTNSVVANFSRVSRVYLQIPIPGVAMPVADVTLAEPVAGESSREQVFTRAARQVADRARAVSGRGEGARREVEDRGAATAMLTAARLQAGEEAIIGVVVRATLEELRASAAQPGVRAVEALPADAVWGRFAARPLQPQQVEIADPLSDDAPVPPA